MTSAHNEMNFSFYYNTAESGTFIKNMVILTGHVDTLYVTSTYIATVQVYTAPFVFIK